ncbi:uncharacterized protein F5147DRAFT_653187 [Suillus discolor]|uniref:F-box domain-containing protein n=1 Tax=Suillus discolor TaxID=1912936 RepID=A0A9P7JTN3_9AGAM|nr:uncharacterized protein F5147DRAFT_653187 [Suillus discolor]KAG2107659.1 hypothetical protein F5147DRAFT_653187 [Suillus discolor]
MSKTDFRGSLGPSKDINALTLESDAPSLKHKINFGDSVTPRKRCILESYSTGNMCQVVAVYSDIMSDIFMKRQVDVQLGPFGIKCVTLYEPCNTKTFIWSLPAEILIATVALLGAQDLCSVTQVSSLLREIAAPLFFIQRNFPTSPKNLFHIRVDSPNFDVLSTWRRMDNFCPPRMVLSWLDSDLRSSQISALSHFLKSIPHKSITYITLFWNFDISTSPVLSQIVALLENICASDVKELTCMGFCDGAVSPSITGLTRIQACIGANNLKAFEASCRVFFSPKILPFTIQTIRLSPCLEKLRLSSIKLSAAHWDKLMRHFTIPTLVELRVDADSHDASPDYITSILHHSSAAMMCWSGTHLMVRIKHLVIDCSDGSASATGATSDSLALSTAWIQALPQVKRVTLRGYSATAAGDLVDIMCSFAPGDVELAVDLQVSPEFCSLEANLSANLKYVAPCNLASPITTRDPDLVRLSTAASVRNAATLEKTACLGILAAKKYPPLLKTVDNLAAELFAITLTDNDVNPDSHSKLWNSCAEVQQEKRQAYHSLDGTATFMVDDTQHIAQDLQAAEKRLLLKGSRSFGYCRTIRDELAVIMMALRNVKHKVSCIVSHRSQLEGSCNDMHRLLCDKEDALSVSSEPIEFDSWAVSVVIFGISRRHGEFFMGVLALILSLAMEAQNPHSESRRQNTHSQIPRSMETALSHFKLDGQTTACVPSADGKLEPIKIFLYHHFHNYLTGLLSCPNLEVLMDRPCDDLLASIGSPPHIIKDVWDANFFRTFKGPSGQSLFIDRGTEGRYTFTLNLDFFNIEGNLQRNASTSTGIISCAYIQTEDWVLRDKNEVHHYAELWKNAETSVERNKLFSLHSVRWSTLWRLSYWDPSHQIVVDNMHCLLEGLVHAHFHEFLGLTADSTNLQV